MFCEVLRVVGVHIFIQLLSTILRQRHAHLIIRDHHNRLYTAFNHLLTVPISKFPIFHPDAFKAQELNQFNGCLEPAYVRVEHVVVHLKCFVLVFCWIVDDVS